MSDLLPPNATATERHLSEAAGSRIDALPVPLRDLWNPDTCPANLLPWLAWALSVDEWDSNWPESTQRAVIAASIEVHRRKGTVGAVRRALVAMGYTHVEVLEHVMYLRDGTYKRDGNITHGDGLGAYEFDVELNAGFEPTPAQVAQIRARVGQYKNARSHLRSLRYMSLHHDGRHLRDGSVKQNGGLVNG